MNPNVASSETVTIALVHQYGDSMYVVQTWALPFALGLTVCAYAAAFFLRLFRSSAQVSHRG